MLLKIRELQKKGYTDILKNHLKSLFYIYLIIFHRKIQSNQRKNLVAALRQCVKHIGSVLHCDGTMEKDNREKRAIFIQTCILYCIVLSILKIKHSHNN